MASSSSSPQPKDKYHAFSGIEPEGIRRKVSESTRLFDVFINHRGPDSKHTLALPLYNSFKKLGIRAFLDLEEMELGHSFPSTIETAIRSAAVHIAIFSKRYAESPWCLAELVLMLQSPAKIIPVFFEVEPWALRHIEKGVYAGAFDEYQKKSRYLEKLKEWKEALQSISYTTGHEIKNLSDSDYESIVSAVQIELQRTKPLHVAKYPVALDKLVQDFERRCLNRLMQDFEIQCGMNGGEEGKAKIVGIFGMGGVGKTTLSKELFNRKRRQFARACFLFDVREASAKNNLSCLQMKLLRDLFNENGISFQSTKEGSSSISECVKRSSSLSFLIVLDDIDHLQQLEDLSITCMLQKPGNSLIVITTRDVGILIGEGIKVGYHLKGMDKDDARELFSWHAFSQSHPASGYEDLVDDFLGVCRGLPLSLQVLGRHVHGRDEIYWRSELRKVGSTMHPDIQRKLKISFDALNPEEKQIFIDMACFFVDQLKSTAIRVWKASGWSAQSGLQALKDKCLVEEIEDPVPVLRMHDHLRDLGREMANELNHPRRLWLPQDLKDLESKGLENIFSQTEGRCFHSIFDKSLNSEVKFFLRESGERPEMLSSLLWLYLHYPYSPNLNHLRRQHHLNFTVQQRIPLWIPLQNMQSLRISNGYFKRLWQQDAEAPSKLKELEIDGTFLEEFPDFLGILTNVEKEVEKDVNDGQHMSKMKSLRVKTLRRFSGFFSMNGGQKSAIGKAPSAIVKVPLSFLEDLVIREQENITSIVINGNYCPKLQSLELSSMKNLIEVQFTRVETLNCLNISKCKFLQRLLVTSDLTHLEELSISACPELEEPCLGHLSYLKKIRVADYNLESVPGISSSRMLVELNISRCPNLHELSLAHLCRLKKVTIKDCDNLKSVTGVSHLQNLVELSISWCWILQLELCLVGLNCLKRITVDKFVKVKCFELNRCKTLETVSGMSFEMIRVVNIHDCPELRELPVICGASGLEGITINGCGKLNNIMLADCGILKRVFGNFDPMGLSILDCPMLEELPCFGHVTYLEEIRILQCGNLKNMSLPTTLKRLELKACTELKSILAISALTKLVELNISECPQLELVVTDLIWLEKLAMTNLKSVSGISNLTKLVELEILECVEIDVDLCLSALSCLKRIAIVECGKMHTIALPTNLTKLSLEACRDLETAVGISGLTKLEELNIKKCHFQLHLSGLNRLKRITIVECQNLYNITMPTALIELRVQRCRKLQVVAGIDNFTKLRELSISKCTELKELPVLSGSCLERITIDGCGNLNCLRLTDCTILKGVWDIFDLNHLAQLWISDCPELEELPCLARLTCLEEIKIFRCRKLQKITLPKTLKSLHLDSCKELKCASGISRLENLVELIISACWQLELQLHLKGMNSLQSITIDGCCKLESFLIDDCQNLKRLSGNFDVASLSICDCPLLEELPSLNCLERINIVSCDKLRTIILPMTPKKVTVQRCRKLQTVAAMGDLTKLIELYISECPELEELPNFSRLNWLETIAIDFCEKLHSIILPMTLMKLTVQQCKKLQTVAGMVTKLRELYISECPELEELPNFSRLNSLETIAIDSCEKLHNVTLPTTLMKLSVQRCRKLKTVAGLGDPTKLTELYISECPELEELPSFSTLSCLKMIEIDSCEKLHSIILPMVLVKVRVQRCRKLKTVAGIGDPTKLTELYISECPELEELPSIARLDCLKVIAIDSCEKLHNIILPTMLRKLKVQRCRQLQTVAGMGHLTELTELYIIECPELEELPVLRGVNRLISITIDRCVRLNRLQVTDCRFLRDVLGLQLVRISDCAELCLFSCEYLQKITLPTTLKSLHLDACPDLRSVSEISNLKNLVQLSISQCRQLELELHLEGMNSLQNIKVDGCPKLKSVVLNKCQNLKRVSLSFDYYIYYEASFSVCDCPELEFLNLGKNSWASIFIYSCEKLKTIESFEDWQALKVMQLLYPSNASIYSCEELEKIEGIEESQVFKAMQSLYSSSAYIHCMPKSSKTVRSEYIQIIGRAAGGAKSNLNLSLFSKASSCTDELRLCRDAEFKRRASAIIICAVVEVNTSVHPPEQFLSKGFHLPQGELVITTVITGQIDILSSKFNEQFEDILFKYGIRKKWCAGAITRGEEWRTLNVLDAIIRKLYKK